MTRLSWSLDPYTVERLQPGPWLVVKTLPGCPVATVAVWIQAGTADETPDHNGTAHFLEHMFFKGTPSQPVGAIDREVKALGGYDNAGTSFDFTDYYICLPAAHWRRALELLADFILHPRLDEADIEAERAVVLEEIGRKEDSPFSKLYQDFLCAAFEGSPYGLPILGEEESLRRIGRETFMRFLAEHYRPERMTLVVVGDLEADAVRRVAGPLFAEMETDGTAPPAPYTPPSWTGPRELRLHKPYQQGYGLVGYTLPDIKGTDEAYALDLASWVLAGGRASRLFRELHEERGLVSDVEASFWEMRRAALWHIEVSYDPENQREVLAIIDRHVERMAAERVREDELERAKRLVVSDMIFSNEKSAAIANTIGQFHLTVGLEELDRFCERSLAVTAEEIREACARYLVAPRRTTALLEALKRDRLLLAATDHGPAE